MSDKGAFSRVSALVSCRLRRLPPGLERSLFHENAQGLAFSPQKLANAHLPEPLLEFLLNLDAKLDLLLSLASQRSIEQDFPIEGQAVELSAAGLSFISPEAFKTGQKVEIVLALSHAPLRMAGALGEITRAEQVGAERRYELDFTSIRDRDREAIVQFVFQEERAKIRESKWS